MNVRQRAPAVQEDLSHRGDQATSRVGRSPSLPPALPALTQRAPEQGPCAGSFIEAGLPAATARGFCCRQGFAKDHSHLGRAGASSSLEDRGPWM